MNMSNLLFVYGTLRPGCAHPMARLLAERAAHVGAARARGRLYNLGRYPGMQETLADDWVLGDLYRLPDDQGRTLQALDDYENAESPIPAFFERCLAEVRTAEGMAQAWIYWFRGAVKQEQQIVGGDWLTGIPATESHFVHTSEAGIRLD